MCGIAGVIFADPLRRNEAAASADRMMRALRHRGPDGEGVWCAPREAPVAVAFRRR
jgi:asparagine synthase (glutamine-hydrolysing)